MTKLLVCSVCSYRYARRYGYGIVTLGRGEDELEQLRSHVRFEVCGDCADVLRSWLGLPPERQVPAREDDPTRPFSCSDERLELS